MNEPIEEKPDAAAEHNPIDPRIKAVLPTGNLVMARLSHCLLEDQVRLAMSMLARNRGIFEVPPDLELEPPVRIAVEHIGEYQDAL